MLRRAEPRAVLLGSLRRVDRLVLLGDVLELRHGPLPDALSAARPVLEQLAGALPAGAEVVIVPGNHDHALLGGWPARLRDGRREPFELETEVRWEAGEPLARIAQWLGPARVRAAYPGVWLRGDVYATHGHYGDRHTTVPMLERLGAGAMARITSEPQGGPMRIEDYEATLAPIYAWVYEIAQQGRANPRGASAHAWRQLTGSTRGRLRRLGLAAAFPTILAALNRAGIGPVRRDLSGEELRRASLRALGEVLRRLGVRAPHVIFGHTHRAGPLPGDQLDEWYAPTGARLLNTGCWVHEPSFLGSRPQQSPYRAGFAALIDDDGFPPGLVNLLDGHITPAPA